MESRHRSPVPADMADHWRRYRDSFEQSFVTDEAQRKAILRFLALEELELVEVVDRLADCILEHGLTPTAMAEVVAAIEAERAKRGGEQDSRREQRDRLWKALLNA